MFFSLPYVAFFSDQGNDCGHFINLIQNLQMPCGCDFFLHVWLICKKKSCVIDHWVSLLLMELLPKTCV